MLDAQFSKRIRLNWVGFALLLHGALLFAVPRGTPESARVSAPIQVSLLDPAPVSASESPALLPPPPPPLVRSPVKPVLSPVSRSAAESASAEIPGVEPVAVVASASSAPARDDGAAGGSDALVEASFDAAYLRNPKPVYPSMSQRLREEGKVMLRVFVLPDGSPQDIEIKRGSGSARLDEAARAAVHRWRFVPARRGDTAVAAWVVVPIVFKLES